MAKRKYVITDSDTGRFLTDFTSAALYWTHGPAHLTFASKKEAQGYLAGVRKAGWLIGDMEIEERKA